MTTTLRRTAAVAIAAAMTATALTAADRADTFTTHDELADRLAGWEQAGATVRVAATSNEGREIPLVSVGRGPRHVLVTGQLHANEPSGTEASIQLIDLLLGDPTSALDERGLASLRHGAPIITTLRSEATRRELLDRVTVHVLPMADPDGVENDHTRDFQANSDYATRVTPQAEAIMSAVRESWPSLFVDLHGGPNEPLNIGIVEPRGTDPLIAAQSLRAAAITWRAAAALDVPVRFFEEHPFGGAFGLDGEPFDSTDEAYYASLSRLVPATWESLQLEGIPAVYTETVGLQSTDPQVTIREGSSIQLATLIGLVLDAAGMFDGTRPSDRLLVEGSGELGSSFEVTQSVRDLEAVVSWPWTDLPVATDWTIELLDTTSGEVVASSASGGPEPNRRSRALHVEELAPGSYRLVARPQGAAPGASAVLRAAWWLPDPHARDLSRLLGPAEDVALCLEGDSAWRRAAGSVGLATATC